MSKTAGLPSWSELLAEIATSVGVDGEMLRQLRRLDLKDQANVLQLTLTLALTLALTLTLTLPLNPNPKLTLSSP